MWAGPGAQANSAAYVPNGMRTERGWQHVPQTAAGFQAASRHFVSLKAGGHMPTEPQMR